MLEKLQLGEYDLYDILDIHDFEPEAIGMTKEKKKKPSKKYINYNNKKTSFNTCFFML